MTGISKRKRIWGWFFFDWASQPYHTLLITFIFGPISPPSPPITSCPPG